MRVLFCSYHSYLDDASGAARATRDLLELMVAHGWSGVVLSGPQLDARNGGPLEAHRPGGSSELRTRVGYVKDTYCTLYRGVRNGVEVQGFLPVGAPPDAEPTRAEGEAFLALFEAVAQRCRPDVLLTYGGQWLAGPLMRRARALGMKVVFALHNCEYPRAGLFADADAVLVPSRAVQEHYWRTLGLSSTVLPGPVNWERARAAAWRGECVTFVSPTPAKGAYWFARIAHELGRRRPDIPFLVVEGRGQWEALAQSGLDLAGLPLQRLATTPEPRTFYARTRLLLVPSQWREALGRVAIEGLINGIPVLASRRGGLPEALAGAGFLFDVPAGHSENGPFRVPSAQEVAPWVATIERLWDDDAAYQSERARCLQAAESWRPDYWWPRFEAFFRGLVQR